MQEPSPNRLAFVDQVLTSRLPGQVAKRFAFADGEAAALYTQEYNPRASRLLPIVLYVATFLPSSPADGLHDYGIDYWQQPVATAAEATHLLAQFDQEAAEQFRASCRPL